jgi:hypothetical protein
MKSKMFMFLLFTVCLFSGVSFSPVSPDGEKICKDLGDFWPCKRSGYRRI